MYKSCVHGRPHERLRAWPHVQQACTEDVFTCYAPAATRRSNTEQCKQRPAEADHTKNHMLRPPQRHGRIATQSAAPCGRDRGPRYWDTMPPKQTFHAKVGEENKPAPETRQHKRQVSPPFDRVTDARSSQARAPRLPPRRRPPPPPKRGGEGRQGTGGQERGSESRREAGERRKARGRKSTRSRPSGARSVRL